jgi:hypothetical protein
MVITELRDGLDREHSTGSPMTGLKNEQMAALPTARDLERKVRDAQAEMLTLEKFAQDRNSHAAFARALRRVGLTDKAFADAESELDSALRRIEELKIEVQELSFAAAYLRYRSAKVELQATMPERDAIAKRRAELIAEEVKEVCAVNTYAPHYRLWAERDIQDKRFAESRLQAGAVRLTDMQLEKAFSASSCARVAEWKSLLARERTRMQLAAGPDQVQQDLIRAYPALAQVIV